MRFCDNCGSRLLDTDKYCAHCGKSIAPEPVQPTKTAALTKGRQNIFQKRASYIALILLLVIILVANIGWNINTRNQLERHTEDIASLTGAIQSIDYNIGGLQSLISGLKDNLSVIDTGLTGVSDRVNEIELRDAVFNANIANLKDDISSLTGSISSMGKNLETLSNNINTMQTELSTYQANNRPWSEILAVVEPAAVRLNVQIPGGSARGSGAIISNKGYVLTAYHVIEDATSITASLESGLYFPVSVVVVDSGRDIALLKIVSERTDFSFINLGSSGNTKLGEEVVAIGYPLSYYLNGQATCTAGIISGYRVLSGYNFIQTDAALAPGNSGGPLINKNGEIIGVNTDIVRDLLGDITVGEGLNFAVPIDEVKGLLQDYISD